MSRFETDERLKLIWLAASAANGALSIGLPIGSGAKSVVHEGFFNGAEVAVKQDKRHVQGGSSPLSPGMSESAAISLSETPADLKVHQYLTELTSSDELPGVLPLIAAFIKEGQFIAVLPLFEFDLRKAMPTILELGEKNADLHKKVVFAFFASMVSALTVFQKAGLVHSDLKPENIAFSPKYKKTEDKKNWMEFSAFDFDTTGKEGERDDFYGTAAYAAPETIGQNKAIFASDTWAIGHILLEMMGAIAPLKNRPLGLAGLVGQSKVAEDAVNAAESQHYSLRELPYFFEVCADDENNFLASLEKAKTFEECVQKIAERMEVTLSDLRPSVEILMKAVIILQKHVSPATKEDYEAFVKLVHEYKSGEPAVKSNGSANSNDSDEWGEVPDELRNLHK